MSETAPRRLEGDGFNVYPFGDPWSPQGYTPAAQPYNALQRCPVCEGRGCLLWDPRAPYATASTSTGPYRCPTCEGARVLNSWGTVDHNRVPPPGTYPNDPPAQP